MFELAVQQIRALEKIKKFLREDTDCFILKGYAGTGKTSLIKEITKLMEPYEIKLLAPTGRAARILQEKTRFSSSTIHSAIYQMVEDKHEEAEADTDYLIKFVVKQFVEDELKLIIVDEASMLGNNLNDHEYIKFGSGRLLNDLITFAKLRSKPSKILFVGDPAQLPPVKTKFSPALSEKFLSEEFKLKVDTFTLTEVFRQDEGSVLDFATDIRNKITQRIYNDLNVKEDTLIRKFNDDKLFLSYYHQAKDKTLVAYDNASVMNFNKKYRKEFLKQGEKLSEGEKLIVVSNNYLYGLYNGDFIEVTKIYQGAIKRIIRLKFKEEESTVEKEIQLSFSKIMYNKWGKKEKDYEAYILDNILYDETSTITKEIYRALIVDFKKRHKNVKPGTEEFSKLIREDPFINSLKVKFGYAITCHKAQGGEWENVFIYSKFIKSIYSEEYLRWLYTAVTRSSRQIYLLEFNPLHFTSKTKVEVNLSGNTGVISATEVTNNDIINCLKDENVKQIATVIFNIYSKKQIKIVTIKEGSYYLRFFLDKTKYFDVYYDGKYTIKSIRIHPSIVSELNERLTSNFEKVKGKVVLAEIKDKKPKGIEYSSIEKKIIDLINQFCDEYNLEISKIEKHNWQLRFFLLKNPDRATINIWYNSKGLIVKIEPLEKKSSSTELLAEILNNIKGFIGK